MWKTIKNIIGVIQMDLEDEQRYNNAVGKFNAVRGEEEQQRIEPLIEIEEDNDY